VSKGYRVPSRTDRTSEITVARPRPLHLPDTAGVQRHRFHSVLAVIQQPPRYIGKASFTARYKCHGQSTHTPVLLNWIKIRREFSSVTVDLNDSSALLAPAIFIESERSWIDCDETRANVALANETNVDHEECNHSSQTIALADTLYMMGMRHS
jgi:hypothetical protein